MADVKHCKFKICCLILIFLPFSSSAANDRNGNSSISHEDILKRWTEFESAAKTGIRYAVKSVLPSLMEAATKLELSAQCMNNGMLLLNNMMKLKPWAIRFIDSSAKSIDGLMGGTLSSLGSFDECLETEARSDRRKDKILFRGQYCTINMKPPLPPLDRFYKLGESMDELKNFTKGENIISDLSKIAHTFYFLSIRLGICVPSGCSTEDIDKVSKAVGRFFKIDASAARCEVKEAKKFTTSAILSITVYCILGLVVFIATSMDIYTKRCNMQFKAASLKILMAFSLVRNYEKLFSTDSKSKSLDFLNGIRFFTMTWVVLSHTHYVINFQVFTEMLKIRDLIEGFGFQVIANGGICVETFFVISGFLACYLTVKSAEDGHRFSTLFYIFHRFWRLFPLLVFCLLAAFLVPLMGSGPLWHETIDTYVPACKRNWWRNLIFINNFFDPKDMCLQHTWYLACDFQLHVAALLILIPLLRQPLVGLTLNFAAILSSVIYSGYVVSVEGFSPTSLPSDADPRQNEFYWSYFFKPFVHVGPYCIGMLSGYILAKKHNLKIPIRYQVAGWCLAVVFNVSSLYGVYEWNRGAQPTFVEKILYAGLHRVAWSAGVAWVIVVCSTGHGGIVSSILSLKPFIPLGRLSFFVYLFHPLIQLVYASNLQTLIEPAHFILVWLFFAYVTASYGLALIGTAMLEAPFLALEKFMFSTKAKVEEIQMSTNKIESQIGTAEQNVENFEHFNNLKNLNKHL